MTIPKTIHQIWIGPAMPEHIGRMTESWRQLHPDWDYKLWTEAEIADLQMRNQTLYDRAERYALPGRTEQFRSDILRYEILATYGGVYVDADFQCLKPIDALLEGVSAFTAWELQNLWINVAIFGTVAGHPFVSELREGLTRHVVRATRRGRDRLSGSRLSGPRYLTRRYQAGSYPDLTIYPQRWFYPYAWNELDRQGEDFDGAYAVHHWHNQRTNGLGRTSS